MKFLLFNIVVTASLIYLLSSPSDLPNLRQKMNHIIGDAAETVISAGRTISGRVEGGVSGFEDQKSVENIRDLPIEQEKAGSPEFKLNVTDKSDLADDFLVSEMNKGIHDEVINIDLDNGSREVAAAEVKPEPPELQGGLPYIDDPVVAQRRAEVLGEPEVASVTGEDTQLSLMSPRERQRELFSLAEEMELLFVEKVGR
ncbi:MAG: hypothetical protein AAEI08_04045 [Gammaproteobacteria bacterium]